MPKNCPDVAQGGGTGKPQPSAPVAPQVPVPAGGDDVDKALATIKKIDATHVEIPKLLVDKITANPMAFAKGARVVPSMTNGKPDGFKLYAIAPGSLFARIGLENGDTLHSANGFELTSADKALEVYSKLRSATSVELEVVRRGKPVTLYIRVI
jgi:general secretion pathway protein C